MYKKSVFQSKYACIVIEKGWKSAFFPDFVAQGDNAVDRYALSSLPLPCKKRLTALQLYDFRVFVTDIRVFEKLGQRDGVVDAKTFRRAGAV